MRMSTAVTGCGWWLLADEYRMRDTTDNRRFWMGNDIPEGVVEECCLNDEWQISREVPLYMHLKLSMLICNVDEFFSWIQWWRWSVQSSDPSPPASHPVPFLALSYLSRVTFPTNFLCARWQAGHCPRLTRAGHNLWPCRESPIRIWSSLISNLRLH